MLPNSPQFAISFWSLLSIGAIVVNLNPMYTFGELSSIAEDTGMTGLVTFDTVRPLHQKLGLKQVLVTRLTDFVNGAGVSYPGGTWSGDGLASFFTGSGGKHQRGSPSG